jgi:hypothetical protein
VPEYPTKPDELTEGATAVTPEVLKTIADAYSNVPEGFTVHPKVAPQLQRRAASITSGPIDWGTGEIIALGSLLMQGRAVRLSGQDTRRGTFVSRFATIIDRHDAGEWTPLAHLSEDQAPFYVYDSLLSEYAAMGFEYGYSVARPEALVMWEAQFGDFVNGAQIVVDEYITSGEAKWGQKSGVVLLLPHGFEGQGPDHSSGRIERFLELAANDAFTVRQPSTPASYFHLLRRHTLREKHQPMIVFTPKSMLRNKAAISAPEEFTSGTVPAGHRRHPGGRRARRAGAAVQRADHVGPDGRAQEARGRRAAYRDRAARAAVPASGRGAEVGAGEVPEPRRAALGPGRAGEHGAVAAPGAEPDATAGRACRSTGCRVRSRRLRRSVRTPPTWSRTRRSCSRPSPDVYFTDRGIEELEARRGDESVTLGWVSERLQEFVDLNPEFETPVERLATWLARLDDEDD